MLENLGIALRKQKKLVLIFFLTIFLPAKKKWGEFSRLFTKSLQNHHNFVTHHGRGRIILGSSWGDILLSAKGA